MALPSKIKLPQKGSVFLCQLRSFIHNLLQLEHSVCFLVCLLLFLQLVMNPTTIFLLRDESIQMWCLPCSVVKLVNCWNGQ